MFPLQATSVDTESSASANILQQDVSTKNTLTTGLLSPAVAMGVVAPAAEYSSSPTPSLPTEDRLSDELVTSESVQALFEDTDAEHLSHSIQVGGQDDNSFCEDTQATSDVDENNFNLEDAQVALQDSQSDAAQDVREVVAALLGHDDEVATDISQHASESAASAANLEVEGADVFTQEDASDDALTAPSEEIHRTAQEGLPADIPSADNTENDAYDTAGIAGTYHEDTAGAYEDEDTAKKFNQGKDEDPDQYGDGLNQNISAQYVAAYNAENYSGGSNTNQNDNKIHRNSNYGYTDNGDYVNDSDYIDDSDYVDDSNSSDNIDGTVFASAEEIIDKQTQRDASEVEPTVEPLTNASDDEAIPLRPAELIKRERLAAKDQFELTESFFDDAWFEWPNSGDIFTTSKDDADDLSKS
jgi:hypothetical protein